VVAGYQVQARIGTGGMAVVFRATDLGLGRTVALKVLSPALAEDYAFRERFIRESRAAAAVDHPNIIPAYAAGEVGGVLYLAMRYVPSGDLRELIRRDGRLSPDRTVRLVSALASALDAAHRADLVHRDVKPANILIDTGSGTADHPYLADFGLAKGSAATGLTGTGQFIGTLQYAAPEQIRGERSVPQTDQYALACVAFTMLTGAVPYPDEGPTAVMWAHMSKPPPSVTGLRPGLPAAVDDVLARAMAKVPGERFPTCGEFAAALRTALQSGGVPAPVQPAPVQPVSVQPAPVQPAPAPPVAHDPAADSADRSAGGDSPVPGVRAETVISLPGSNAAGGSTAHPRGTLDDGQDRTADMAIPVPVADPVNDPIAGASGAGASLGGGGASAGSGAGLMAEPALASGPPAASGTGSSAANGTVPMARPAGRPLRRYALIAAAVLVVGAGGALLGAHPWTHPPVLEPTGLGVHGATTSSLSIGWLGPADGPLPDTYEIVRDNAVVGSVPGSVTRYTDSGLVPDSGYQYQVYAVRGGARSPVSAEVSGRTGVPPVSAARFVWDASVTFTMKSLVPVAPHWDKQPGKSWSTDSWTITPQCASGACNVALRGDYDGSPIVATLTRSGSVYSGVAQMHDDFGCGNLNNDVSGTLAIRVTASSAGVADGQWRVKSFAGNATLFIPAQHTCSDLTAKNTVSGG
jgi:serine/threonine-protein kinase